jgi:hypothetical protein
MGRQQQLGQQQVLQVQTSRVVLLVTAQMASRQPWIMAKQQMTVGKGQQQQQMGTAEPQQ